MIGDKPKKIFILIDGLGYNLLQEASKKDKEISRLLDDFNIKKITTLYPSTTPTILSSVDSGTTVAEHGVVGNKMSVREVGSIISTLGYSSLLNPGSPIKQNILEYHDIFPTPNLTDKIKKNHSAILIVPYEIAKSEYIKAMFGDMEKRLSLTFEDTIIQISKLVKKNKYDFIYVYYGTIDSANHLYCPGTKEVVELIKGIFNSLERLLIPILKKADYNLIITADHGAITSSIKDFTVIYPRDTISSYLTSPPWGEPRAPFFSVVYGKEKQFEDAIYKECKNNIILLSSDEAIKAGLFGKKKVSDRLLTRFGTHIVILKDTYSIRYSYGKPQKRRKRNNRKFGVHGGLSADEMYVPVILY